MNPLKRLNEIAPIAINPYVTSLTVRIDAAIRYPIHLESLHIYPSDTIGSIVRQYNSHLDQFLDVIEDIDQHPDIKTNMLKFPIERGMNLLAGSAFRQRKAEAPDKILQEMPNRIRKNVLMKTYLNVNFGLAAKTPDSSIVTHSQNELHFKQILERLCRIAEDKEQFTPVRTGAISAMKIVHQVGVISFGLNLDREELNGRMLDIGISTECKDLTKSALQFADGFTPRARNPSQP